MPGNISKKVAGENKSRAKSSKKTSAAKKKAVQVKKPALNKAKSIEDSNEQKSEPVIEIQETIATLVLGPVLVINRSNELHASFESYLTVAKASLKIDASAVEMIDTAIIQLLYAFVSSAAKKGIKITWVSPSNEFCSRVRSLGMADKLGIQNQDHKLSK